MLPVMAKRGRPATRSDEKHPNNIRALREARGLSLAKLGELVGWVPQRVHRVELGDSRLKVDDVELFARAFDVEAAEVIGRRAMGVPVVGYIGAGAEVLPIDDHAKGAGLDEVECPRGMDPAKTVAVKVRGDSI